MIYRTPVHYHKENGCCSTIPAAASLGPDINIGRLLLLIAKQVLYESIIQYQSQRSFLQPTLLADTDLSINCRRLHAGLAGHAILQI